jgi:hypothetical protein
LPHLAKVVRGGAPLGRAGQGTPQESPDVCFDLKENWADSHKQKKINAGYELDTQKGYFEAREVGIVCAGAAVASAVFYATGVRVREFPIALDKILAGLSQPI